MDSKEQQASTAAPSPAGEVLSTVADIGLAATEDIPVSEILDTVTEAASAATESISEAIGSVFDSF